MFICSFFFFFFFFNDTATTEIYTLSLHDALPICPRQRVASSAARPHSPTPRTRNTVTRRSPRKPAGRTGSGDRKSTRLNSSHGYISYAVFCLKKKKNNTYETLDHK